MGKTKKPALRLLPPDWRESIWAMASTPEWQQSRPQLLPALAVLWVTGCRPAELEQGIELVTGRDSLVVKIMGAKCVDAGGRERGQPTRHIGFSVDANANPALRFLHTLAGQNAVDGIGKYTIAHNRDYLYNSIVALGRSAFPKLRTRISPYCFRHQVASDLKAATSEREITLEQAAKVMGHLSDYSIGAYGHAVHGRRGRGGRIKVPYVTSARPIKHSPKVDRLARFKMASAKRREHKAE
ncbi:MULTISPECIES: site-specific integrase [Burkholderia cepacia complex]|uniref:site-specific integrase n=1 Tax=Burkholderia cepacia complex TaxID=87882 RepID=UPI000A719060|nr:MULTISPECIES: site-specific integrase [Burkholderia cepacia complex]